MTFNPSDLLTIAPEMTTLFLALMIIVIELIVTRNEVALQLIAIIGLFAVIAIAVLVHGSQHGAFSSMIAADTFTLYVKVLLGGIALLTVMMSREYMK